MGDMVKKATRQDRYRINLLIDKHFVIEDNGIYGAWGPGWSSEAIASTINEDAKDWNNSGVHPSAVMSGTVTVSHVIGELHGRNLRLAAARPTATQTNKLLQNEIVSLRAHQRVQDGQIKQLQQDVARLYTESGLRSSNNSLKVFDLTSK